MKLSDFHIVYINLGRREDKKEHIEHEIEKMNLSLNTHRFNAIDATKINGEDQEKLIGNFKTLAKKKDRILGRIGCYLSHKRVLECALESGVENILILEDDVCFTNQNIVLPELPEDCLMFYLGGLFWRKEKEPLEQIEENNKKTWIKIDTKYNKLACAFSYGIVGRENILKVLEIIHSVKPTAIDILYINHIQKNYSTYVCNPIRAYQTNKFTSDVSYVGAKNPKSPYNNSYWYDGKGEIDIEDE